MVLFNMKCLPFLQKSQDYPFHSITEASRAGRGRGPIRGEESPLWSEPIYECEQCGACCANRGSFPATGYVFLTKDESKLARPKFHDPTYELTKGPRLL